MNEEPKVPGESICVCGFQRNADGQILNDIVCNWYGFDRDGANAIQSGLIRAVEEAIASMGAVQHPEGEKLRAEALSAISAG